MALERRIFVGLITGGGALWAVGAWRGVSAPPVGRGPVTIAEFDSAGRRTMMRRRTPVVKSDAEWRRQLAPDQYSMTRRGDTELAYAGAYWNTFEDGLYRCVCCETALFDAKDKFASGTGWPSFHRAIAAENVREREDVSFGMRRTAVNCSLCAAHLGHVFDDLVDGERPGDRERRYCINSVALRFVQRAPNFT